MTKTKQPKRTPFDQLTQIALPLLTMAGFLLTSLKYPAYGLVLNLLSQIFWLYAGWVAWKKADQIGLFITALGITAILMFGVVNYFVLGA